jgi:hypothetical protein
VLFAGVIEGRGTLHPERHGAAHHLDATDDLVALVATLLSAYRHVVRDLSNPVGREEPRDQDVGIRPVELFGGDFASFR